MEDGAAARLLKTYFGYDDFHPYQKDVLSSILARRDVLAVIATGGGKSLCYQFPAIVTKGMTVVISPLIALMKDQVDALLENGIEAGFLNSTQEYADRLSVEKAALSGRLRILYISPERVVQPGFIRFLRNLHIGLFAIDEAHCISQWGHEFRPEYRQLGKLKQEFREIPVIALTATATPAVQQDIVAQLNLVNPHIVIGSFYRKNLSYEVLEKNNAYGMLIGYLKNHRRDAGIIYCNSKKTVETLAGRLNRDGFRALPYHAGLPRQMRTSTQDKFIRDDIEIIVATIAFGMGIDKPNVRFVIHYDLPKNLEQYYQETGRAGRDGERSDCILFYTPADRGRIRYFIERMESNTERRVARRKLEEMIEFCEGTTCRVRMLLNYFGEPCSFKCGNCDNCRHPRETFDGTEIARTAVTCISQLGNAYGIRYIADVLCGSQNKKIRERGDDRLPAWGSGKAYNRNEWAAYLKELIRLGYLELEGDRYPVVRTTAMSDEVLNGSAQIMLTRKVAAPDAADAATGLISDPGLFERLRRLRKQIADAEGVPPYVIFSDSTLREMAAARPSSPEALVGIRGVGERKLARFGERFIREITSGAAPTAPQSDSPSVERTRELYLQGLTIREIARLRDLTEEVVGAHIEELILGGEEFSIDDLVVPEKQKEIQAALEKYGDENLKTLHDALGDRYTLNDIRLVRAYLKKRSERG